MGFERMKKALDKSKEKFLKIYGKQNIPIINSPILIFNNFDFDNTMSPKFIHTHIFPHGVFFIEYPEKQSWNLYHTLLNDTPHKQYYLWFYNKEKWVEKSIKTLDKTYNGLITDIIQIGTIKDVNILQKYEKTNYLLQPSKKSKMKIMPEILIKEDAYYMLETFIKTLGKGYNSIIMYFYNDKYRKITLYDTTGQIWFRMLLMKAYRIDYE